MLGDRFSWPERIDGIERLILHWTAGDPDLPAVGLHIATPEELRSYHILLEHEEGATPEPDDDEIRITEGVAIAANAGDVRGGPSAQRNAGGYAAHTRGFNSGSIGLSLCGMRDAVDYRPGAGALGAVDPGPTPISRRQVQTMIGLCVQFVQIWDFPISPSRIMTHYEAECELAGGHEPQPLRRWDITWIPGEDLSRRDAGDWIRNQVKAAFDGGRALGGVP